MKFYHSLEILLANKLQNKFQRDTWKETEIISKKKKTPKNVKIFKYTKSYFVGGRVREREDSVLFYQNFV
jgi:hypothetical protein